MDLYFQEFLTLALVHFLAVASPGPDFAIILRQSISYGRRTAVWTGIGIGFGVLVHVFYCILGLGLIISQSILAFTVVKLLGAAYLIYIGWMAIQSKKKDLEIETQTTATLAPSNFRAFTTGFITNVLNPKATLFFLALFSVIISPTTPVIIQFAYGLWMLTATALWFSTLGLVFSMQFFRNLFHAIGHWFERIMGTILIALGIKLAFTERS